MSGYRMVVECTNPDCASPAPRTKLGIPECARGIALVPRPVCTSCGCELFVHNSDSTSAKEQRAW